MSIVQMKEVCKHYGNVKALDQISLDIKKGEWVSVMGPSGSGKSTFLNMVGCMDQPTSGSIWIDGTEISRLTARELTEVRRDKIGLVFQQFHLIPYLTAVENVMLAQYYHSIPDEKEALESLERVGLKERAYHLPSQLSGGEQQRVCIARALINYPAIILADEPTGNLDGTNEKIVIELFKELHKQGHTIIMVTHSPAVGKLAQRQLQLVHGKLSQLTLQAV
ncbi:ABC transporter ATP-binding protein [Microaerobacter geothermalis]|uniref:ABC transporter ATP-binding protein n=1 Tax=Microaerobacter geothermalis TaxID=674972 RepID=UPI001F2044DB|nr:ABC transporter ATP-binding protein [Microaerobacter geothermalis]MCF6094405.1 ABC transporter ATP-binding protein [Microaerobacter geothermalis]